MAKRYFNPSEREQNFDQQKRNREERFGGSRREQNMGEYGQGQGFWGGSAGRWSGGRRSFGQGEEGRYQVGRDFMTNQPEYSDYGEMENPYYEGEQRFSGQRFGRQRYSEPSREFTERGGSSGGGFGRFGQWRRDVGDVERDYDYESGRTPFDETISGRPYYGQGSYREGWRGYGSRPGFMGFGERERPDEWNREAYGSSRWWPERERFGGRNTRYFSSEYGPGQYRGYEYERPRRDQGETFGEKVKNFFGIGPKGYHRSDDRIREDISERLEDHPDIDASNIEVVVVSGEVTLTGTTNDRRAKRLAEDIAEEARGVKDVHNQLRIVSPTGQPMLGEVTPTTPTTTTGKTETTGRRGEKAA